MDAAVLIRDYSEKCPEVIKDSLVKRLLCCGFVCLGQNELAECEGDRYNQNGDEDGQPGFHFEITE